MYERKERILYLDIARGFAVLFMFTHHCQMIFENSAGGSDGLPSLIFALLGTVPAAPVFLVLMGASLMNSDLSGRDQIIRGLKLLGLGYLLNIMRLPLVLAQGDSAGSVLGGTLYNILTYNDFLQLAGLSVILSPFLKRMLRLHWLPPMLFTAILLLSPLLWGLFPENPFLLILWGAGKSTAFPLFPWIIYPLLGMYLSPLLLAPSEQLDFELNHLAGQGTVLALMAVILIVMEVGPVGDYSRSGISIHLLLIGFVFIWLLICRLMARSLNPGGRVVTLLCFLSRNIATIYFLQWILFSWLTLLIGTDTCDPIVSALSGLMVFVVTVLLARRREIRTLFAFTRV